MSGFSVIRGMPGIKLRSSPPMTSTIGYGVCSFFANAPKTTTKNSNNKSTISIEWISPSTKASAPKIHQRILRGAMARPHSFNTRSPDSTSQFPITEVVEMWDRHSSVSPVAKEFCPMPDILNQARQYLKAIEDGDAIYVASLFSPDAVIEQL